MALVASQPADIKREIDHIDLSNTQKRLVKQYDPETLNQMIEEYRKFLFLIHQYPTASMVPSHLIDEVWHDHILHTRNYSEDCKRVFGQFIHHNPSTSEDGEDISETFDLYTRTFGSEPPTNIWTCEKDSFCTKCCGNKCGKNCHGGGCRGGN
jgi:hypothetical protein